MYQDRIVLHCIGYHHLALFPPHRLQRQHWVVLAEAVGYVNRGTLSVPGYTDSEFCVATILQ